MPAGTLIQGDVGDQDATVLIIDDDAEILEALTAVLEVDAPGIEVVSASNLDEAYLALEERGPDLVLIDISLGAQNGLDVLPFIRKRYPDMICIMMTAHRDVEYAAKAIRNGADDYLHKPLDPLAFLNTINGYLEQQRVARKTAEVEARYRAMFEQTFQMVFLLDVEGNILEVNNTALNFRQEQKANIVGKPFWSAPWFNKTGLTARESLQLYFQQALVGKTIRSEVRIVDINGRNRTFDISLKPVLSGNGRVQYVLAEARDVTDYRETQEKLLELTDTLENRISERTAEADRARIEAQRASAAKSDFLARMSHELRTPMNAVLGFSQLLDSGSAGELTEEQKEMVGEVLGAGRHLLELIEELLNLSKIESGDFNIELHAMDIASVVKSSVSMLMPDILERGLVIEDRVSTMDAVVLADELRAREIMINLLSNAVKYNREGGRIDIRAETPERDMFRVIVEDSGPGIAEKDFPRVFEPFDRIDQDYKTVGSGIGLAVSRKLAEKMGGSLGFDSTEGVGSRFWVDFRRSEQ